eukprot:153572-Prorocentrum_minimum.AAC.1
MRSSQPRPQRPNHHLLGPLPPVVRKFLGHACRTCQVGRAERRNFKSGEAIANFKSGRVIKRFNGPSDRTPGSKSLEIQRRP